MSTYSNFDGTSLFRYRAILLPRALVVELLPSFPSMRLWITGSGFGSLMKDASGSWSIRPTSHVDLSIAKAHYGARRRPIYKPTLRYNQVYSEELGQAAHAATLGIKPACQKRRAGKRWSSTPCHVTPELLNYGLSTNCHRWTEQSTSSSYRHQATPEARHRDRRSLPRSSKNSPGHIRKPQSQDLESRRSRCYHPTDRPSRRDDVSLLLSRARLINGGWTEGPDRCMHC